MVIENPKEKQMVGNRKEKLMVFDMHLPEETEKVLFFFFFGFICWHNPWNKKCKNIFVSCFILDCFCLE